MNNCCSTPIPVSISHISNSKVCNSTEITQLFNFLLQLYCMSTETPSQNHPHLHQHLASGSVVKNLLQPLSTSVTSIAGVNDSITSTASHLNVEERLNQIHDCIRITSSLISSIQDKVCLTVESISWNIV